jgi:hypothetical protein
MYYSLEDLEKVETLYSTTTDELLYQKINGVWVDNKGKKVDKKTVLNHWNGIEGAITEINLITEMVYHPSHYGGADNVYEVIKIIEHFGLDFHIGNLVKYVLRAGKKDAELQDLKKARWYLDRKIQNLENYNKNA